MKVMKRMFLILVLMCISFSLFAAYTYTAEIPHPYTGEMFEYSITVNDNDTYTILFFENTRTFSLSDFSDGTYQQWLIDIIEEMYPVSSSGTVSQSLSGLSNTINNSSVTMGAVRTRMQGTSERKESTAEDLSKEKMIFKIIPDVSFLMYNSTPIYHIAAGISGEKSMLNFHVKPWADFVSAESFNIGADAGFQGLSYIGDDMDLTIGFGLFLGYYDSILSNTGFSMGLNISAGFGYYIGDSILLSAGGAYNLNLDMLKLSHGYALGANALNAISEDMFISVYYSIASSFGGLSLDSGMPVTGGGMIMDAGGSLGYYFSDSFFLELGGQYIYQFEGESMFGFSLGSSYRF